jgi:hypothetical protein
MSVKIKSTLLFAAVFGIAAIGIPQRSDAQTPMTDSALAGSSEPSSPSLCLCENAWDFNTPFGVPGFGPIRPNDVGASLAQLQIGDSPAVIGDKHLASRSLKREALHIQP